MNKFTNDGSFMEQFRKRMENQKSNKEEDKDTKSPDKCVSQCKDKNEAGDETVSTENRCPAPVPIIDTNSGPRPSSSSVDCSSIDTNTVADDTTKPTVTSSSVDDANDKQLPVKKKQSVLSFVGKRPGSKLTLKTGQVKKKRQQEEESEPTDAWSKYMAEVKKFRKGLDEDANSRPLIK